jgi:hypothetical protein
MKRAAFIVCILYICIQSFQWWVFSRLPESGSQAADFLSGHERLNIIRSVCMLLAMFGLLYVFFAVCYAGFSHNKIASLFAFLGYFVFFILEICLRSVELFYIQIQLPNEYLATGDQTVRQNILHTVQTFAGIQHALYFPLMFCTLLSSLIIIATFPRTPRINYIILLVFVLNSLRLIFRIKGSFIVADPVSDFLNGALYLPLVYVFFGLKAFWFLKTHRLQSGASGKHFSQISSLK